MNNLKTDIDGGFPLRLDDFRWLFEAEKEALKGIIKSLIGDETSCKLYGCVVVDTEQGDVWTCTEGFIYMLNEIFYVPAHQIVDGTGNGNLTFQVDLTYDATGLKTFEDASQHDTYEYRRAKLSNGSTPGMTYMADTLINILARRLGLISSWSSFALNSSNVTIDGPGALSLISGRMAYKVVGKTVFCSINLYLTLSQPGLLDNGYNFRIEMPESVRVGDNYTVPTSLVWNYTQRDIDAILRAQARSAWIEIGRIDQQSLLDAQYAIRGELFYEASGTFLPTSIISGGSTGISSLTLLYSGESDGSEGEEFTLSALPSGDVLVFSAGAPLNPATDYTLDGLVVTLVHSLNEFDPVYIYGTSS